MVFMVHGSNSMYVKLMRHLSPEEGRQCLQCAQPWGVHSFWALKSKCVCLASTERKRGGYTNSVLWLFCSSLSFFIEMKRHITFHSNLRDLVAWLGVIVFCKENKTNSWKFSPDVAIASYWLWNVTLTFVFDEDHKSLKQEMTLLTNSILHIEWN